MTKLDFPDGQSLVTLVVLLDEFAANFSMTQKLFHEIRDPIHVFIRLDSDERRVLDSRPVQRLRNIHQLAMEYLVYPGATHKRFEHALGVMELASRVFDVITRQDVVHETMRRVVPEIGNEDQKRYWRRVLRMAALCHDIGHLPFSHAAEHELLPPGWTHETISADLIRSDEMQTIWVNITPPLRTEDIMKLAVGQEKLPDVQFTDWEAMLSEIVVGNAFGVDRMDYLLRDSLHTGVQYGRFDHYRLIDTLRILPKDDRSEEPTLGLESGGLQSAEALLLARYSMFSQVYLHPVRRAYDLHLKEFLKEWLPKDTFPTEIEEFLTYSDIEVLAGIMNEARKDGNDKLQVAAKRIAERRHFKRVFSGTSGEVAQDDEPGKIVSDALSREFGEENIRLDSHIPNGPVFDFPVLQADNRIVSSLSVSDLLGRIPVAKIDYVFVEPSLRTEATNWLKQHRDSILAGPVYKEET